MFKIGDLVIGNKNTYNMAYEEFFKLYSKPHKIVDIYEQELFNHETNSKEKHQFVILEGFEPKKYTVEEFNGDEKARKHAALREDTAIIDRFLEKYNG